MTSTAWHSPQSIYSLGHRAVKDLFSVPCQIQEKIDGSFFAFGLFPEIDTGEGPLRIRSKGAVMLPDAPERMFAPAAKAVKDRAALLRPGWQYRGEFLAKPKHNALAYNRTPVDNIILFDICTDEETYLAYGELCQEASRIGLEVVPQLRTDATIKSADEIRTLLDTVSILGGQKIEGVVVKPLVPVFGRDKKMLFAKFVSEAFKEVHRKAWGESNPSNKDIITRIGEMYTTPARWQKAVQHLRESGVIEDSPKDIGLIMKEVPLDVLKEEAEEIKERLFKYAWPHIARMLTRGLPEWYREQLLKKQFEADVASLEGR